MTDASFTPRVKLQDNLSERVKRMIRKVDGLSAKLRLRQAGSPWRMGPFEPRGAIKRMAYIGCSRKLLGRVALVSFDPFTKKAYAQFNDHETGKSYGWWPFSMHVWEEAE